jgi:hypothetical protein
MKSCAFLRSRQVRSLTDKRARTTVRKVQSHALPAEVKIYECGPRESVKPLCHLIDYIVNYCLH